MKAIYLVNLILVLLAGCGAVRINVYSEPLDQSNVGTLSWQAYLGDSADPIRRAGDKKISCCCG